MEVRISTYGFFGGEHYSAHNNHQATHFNDLKFLSTEEKNRVCCCFLYGFVVIMYNFDLKKEREGRKEKNKGKKLETVK